MTRALAAALVLSLLPLGGAPAQEPPPKPRVLHTSPNPWKCKACLPAYEKALGHVRDRLRQSPFAAQMIAAWTLLADGRHEKDLDTCVKQARRWREARGTQQHAQNWYPALAGAFLAEHYKYYPSAETKRCLEEIVAEFVRTQEITGGWFKWPEGAYKDRLDYPAKDLGMLTSIIFGMFWTVKVFGVEVPEATLRKATDCLAKLCTARGISYGTPQQGGEPTGARGSFVLVGLDYAGQREHEIFKTYRKLLPKLIPNLQKGHHVGGLHALGVTLGCRVLGPECARELTGTWLDHYIGAQEPDGAVYIGDDGDAGGEIGLLKGKVASTAAFGLMILLQDPRMLRPGKKPGETKPNPYLAAGGR
ncbi:MAG: hypothetical protein L0216_03815 [Planctomycetales bacterium]|nr:hypothetical protein [Planctomycetales bacterium]